MSVLSVEPWTHLPSELVVSYGFINSKAFGLTIICGLLGISTVYDPIFSLILYNLILHDFSHSGV